MRSFAVLFAVLLLPACATLGGGRSGGADRAELWNQAHDAFSRDSFRLAEERFQRLAAEFPRTHEGHEASFYLGVLAMEPRGRVDFQAALRHLGTYLAADSLRNPGGWHAREAETLHRMARVLTTPCGQRVPAIFCETLVSVDTVTRTAPSSSDGAAAASAAEAARLRRVVADRDAKIRELEAELQRIRNTLAPRSPRE
jgi:hypothetical protein